MAVVIVVEDGTGKTDATSYVSRADFDAYWTQKGVDYTNTTTYPNDTINLWLNDATQLADSMYCYCGYVANDGQALDVPRDNWYDERGNDLSDSVPVKLKNAVCELAVALQGASADSDRESGVASKKYGSISTSYTGGNNANTTRDFPSADRWMTGLVCSTVGLMGFPR